MKGFFRTILGVLVVGLPLMFTSCTINIEDDDDYLAGTEWATEEGTEILTFLRGETVAYTNEYGTWRSDYDYERSTGIIEFDYLVSEFPMISAVITDGYVTSSTIGSSMKLYWHAKGDTEQFYMYMFRVK